MQKRNIFYFLFTLFLFTSCITAKKVNYLQDKNITIPHYKDSTIYKDYKLNTGDRIYIKVFSTSEEVNYMFNLAPQIENQVLLGNNVYSELYTYLVKSDGNIIFPMLDDVYVKGKTVREIKSILEEKLTPLIAGGSNQCSVEVRVVSRYFSVIGGSASGRFPITKEKINIFQALALAGDIGVYGDRSKIRIIRETENGTEIKMFDIRSVDIINSEYYYIEPNDVIYIQTVNEQFFSMTSFASVLSAVFSTLSFGLLIYNSIQRL